VGSNDELRVLIVAEHASARFGGEAILPLHYFRLLRRRGVEAWLVVHERTREELSRLLPEEANRIHYLPDTAVHRFLYWLGRPLPSRVELFTTGLLMRLLTQWTARHLSRRLVRAHCITVVHQPIPVSPKETSLLSGLGAPVVIGPMNGGMEYPPGFGRAEGRFASLFTHLGRRLAPLVNRFLPGKLQATTLLVANERTRRALPPGVRGRVVELVENGVDLGLWRETDTSPRDGPVRFLFVGRLVDWKAVDLLLDAFARVAEKESATLDIIGDGPMRPALEEQARRLGISSAVTFRGWVPQAEVARHLRDADVFVLPSLYECGGAVVLEAMAAALPVVATAWGGPTDYLDANCGILVPPTSPTELVAGLASAMLDLATSPSKRRQLGQAGRERVVREFDWERKIDRVLDLFSETVRRARGTTPRRLTRRNQQVRLASR
jgi:glycosyltransferase involved in cell wall biosynthesis